MLINRVQRSKKDRYSIVEGVAAAAELDRRAQMAGYPKVYNIEMDPHEDLVVGGMFGWVSGPALKTVEEYLASVKRYPNPPAPNITQFGGG